MPAHRAAGSCCTPRHCRATPMRSSPAARSSKPYVDKGYRGHKTANPRRVFISGQKRGVFGVIKRELRRRSAIEPVIGHMKTDGHLGRCHVKGREGDAANVVLSAVAPPHRPRLVEDAVALNPDRPTAPVAVQSAIQPASSRPPVS